MFRELVSSEVGAVQICVSVVVIIICAQQLGCTHCYRMYRIIYARTKIALVECHLDVFNAYRQNTEQSGIKLPAVISAAYHRQCFACPVDLQLLVMTSDQYGDYFRDGR